MSEPAPPEAAPAKDRRRAMRDRALAAREALAESERTELTQRLTAHLAPLLRELAPRRLAFCWPYRGEPDLRDFVADWLAQDDSRQAALPRILAPGAPLAFLRWRPGDEVVPDAHGIPVPASMDAIRPDLALIPVNAFDEQAYRLGYGGGFFDRTLAALAPPPVAVGLGFELARVTTILPEPHDRRMNWIVTENGVMRGA